jgi:diacylglycerol kinase (ATP)
MYHAHPTHTIHIDPRSENLIFLTRRQAFFIVLQYWVLSSSEDRMGNQQRTGWRRLWAAAGYSIQGLRAAWINEAAFRQELLLVLVLAPLAFWLGTTAIQRALLILSLLLVLITELLNSAIEAAVDRIGNERHELSGRAKNMGSAAVLIALVAAAGIWVLIALENWRT